MNTILSIFALEDTVVWALVAADGAVIGSGVAGDAPLDVATIVSVTRPTFAAVYETDEEHAPWVAGLAVGAIVMAGVHLVDPAETHELDEETLAAMAQGLGFSEEVAAAVGLGQRVARLVRRGGVPVATGWSEPSRAS
jgi:hypothetical protein